MAKPKPSVASRMDAGYFRRTDAEHDDREQGSTAVTEDRNNAVVEPWIAGAPEDRGNGAADPMPPADPPKAKRSYMLPAATVVLLERVQLADLIRTGEKPDLSELVTEAIALLAQARGLGDVGDAG